MQVFEKTTQIFMFKYAFCNLASVKCRGVENSCYSSPLSGLATGTLSGRITRIDWFSRPSKIYKSHG